MRLLVRIEYDGTDFEGFQVQGRGRTVQGELERALLQITGVAVRITGGGRTDSGVHALGQTAHFDTEWNRPPETLQRALNAVLPRDISIRSLTRVAPEFSARYSAIGRSYRYTILNQAIRSPLAAPYVLHVKDTLDAEAMNAAAKCLIGKRDFGAFGTPPHGDNSVRHLRRAEVRRSDPNIWIELEANAFLYRMVRRIVGTLLWVGRHEMSVDEFCQVIAKERRAGPAVSPQGLCLIAVEYDLATESP